MAAVTLRAEALRRWNPVPAVAAAVVAHGVVGWALWQQPAARETVAAVTPQFVHLVVAAPAPPPQPVLAPVAVPPPPEPARPAPPPRQRPPTPRPVVPPTPAPLLAAAPGPADAPLALTAPTSNLPAPAPAAPVAESPAAAPEPAPAAPPSPPSPPPPKTVPATAVQYLAPPAPVYPATSRRLRETGRVLVRVLIDAGGLPRETRLQQSSGHPRLDTSALDAVRATRFRPYTEDGLSVPVWVLIPITYELEQS